MQPLATMAANPSPDGRLPLLAQADDGNGTDGNYPISLDALQTAIQPSPQSPSGATISGSAVPSATGADSLAGAAPAAGGSPSAPNSPPPTPPAATPKQQTYDQKLFQFMAARGHADYASKYLQNQAVSREAQLRAQQMQQEQDNQDQWQADIKTTGGDLHAAYGLAAQHGVTTDYLDQKRIQEAKVVEAKTKAWDSDQSMKLAQSIKLLPRLNALIANKYSPEELAKQWPNWAAAQHDDQLVSDKDYLAMQQAHGPNSPPTNPQLIDYRNHLQADVQTSQQAQQQALLRDANAKADLAETNAEQAKTAEVAGALSESSNPKQWDSILNAAPPAIRAKFPQSQDAFDKDGNPDNDVMQGTRRIGQTVQQRVVSDQTAVTQQGLAAYRAQQIKVQNRMADARMAQANRDSAVKETAENQAVANAYVSANGGDFDKAIASLGTSGNPRAVQAIAILNSGKQGGAKVNLTDAQTAAANAQADKTNTAADKALPQDQIYWLNAARKANPKATINLSDAPTSKDAIYTQYPRAGAKPAAAPVKPAAIAPAAVAPPAKTPPPTTPAQKVRANIPGHGTMEFPSQAAFKQFQDDHPEFTWK